MNLFEGRRRIVTKNGEIGLLPLAQIRNGSGLAKGFLNLCCKKPERKKDSTIGFVLTIKTCAMKMETLVR